MSKTSNQPMWPMRKIFPLKCALARRQRDAVPVAQVAEQLGAVDRRPGTRTAVTTAAESSSGEKSSSPIAFTPARAARPRRTCRSNAGLEAVVEDHPERDVEARGSARRPA